MCNSAAVWRKLVSYALPRTRALACDAFHTGEGHLQYHADAPLDPAALAIQVRRATGWQLIPADGEVPMPEFFAMLRERAFPMVTTLRPIEQLFAALDPDLWHEAVGHAPLLFDAQVGDLYEAFGRHACAVQHAHPHRFAALTKLYWFVGEYGLLQTSQGPRLLGAALLAAPMTSERWQRNVYTVRPYALGAVLRASYEPHKLQRKLFCVNGLTRVHADIAHIARGSCDKRWSWAPAWGTS